MNRISMQHKEISGLHTGISEVASNVTLICDNNIIKGKESKMHGRLSFHEYEIIGASERELRKSKNDTSNTSIFVKKQDYDTQGLKSSEKCNQDVTTIVERELRLE